MARRENKEPKAWEFWEGVDNRNSFPAFERLLNSPLPRPTLAQLAELTGVPSGTLAYYSSDHAWTERIKAYDQHLAKATARASESEAVRIGRRHARAARKAHTFATRLLERFASHEADFEARGVKEPIQKLRDVIRVLDIAFKHERLLLGQATERIEGSAVDLGALSEEEFAQYEALCAKAGAGKPKD